jgi:hypothetical protein
MLFKITSLRQEEESRIANVQREFALENVGEVQERLVKAAVLRDLDNGIVKSRLAVQGVLPVALTRGEQLLWLFKGVTFFQLRTKTHYVGRSHGVSLRVMRGVYYRIGSSRGKPVTTEQLTEVDTGLLLVTQKKVSFKGTARSTSIPTAKILSVDASSDGIAVMQDAANAKPKVFKLDDPWFATNLILKTAAL